jgi:hypothetical protein
MSFMSARYDSADPNYVGKFADRATTDNDSAGITVTLSQASRRGERNTATFTGAHLTPGTSPYPLQQPTSERNGITAHP